VLTGTAGKSPSGELRSFGGRWKILDLQTLEGPEYLKFHRPRRDWNPPMELSPSEAMRPLGRISATIRLPDLTRGRGVSGPYQKPGQPEAGRVP